MDKSHSDGSEDDSATKPDHRKFKCEKCGMGFKKKHHLQRHMQSSNCQPRGCQIETKPFVCLTCGHRFRQHASLYNHQTQMGKKGKQENWCVGKKHHETQNQ